MLQALKAYPNQNKIKINLVFKSAFFSELQVN